MTHRIHALEDSAAVASHAARRVAELVSEQSRARGVAHLALAGGGTPKAMYAVLATLPGIDWSRVHLWWGDERCVPDTDKDSNQRTAHEALISKVTVPAANVHRVPTHLAPAACAATYEDELRRTIGTPVPSIDILLLGIGTDGHTLSLFPGSPALQEQTRLVVATHAPATSPVRDRVTFTLPLSRAARHRIFLATGAEKKPLVQACVSTSKPGGMWPSIVADASYPAALVGEAEWFLDRAAAP